MKNKDKIFQEELFTLYGKVIKGDADSTKKFKEIFYKHYPNKQAYFEDGFFTKKEYLHTMYNWLITMKL